MSEQSGKGGLKTAQQMSDFFETLLRASADGIVITDATQNIILANESFCAFLGRRRQDVIETSLLVWLDHLDADARTRWAELEKCARFEASCRDVEFRIATNEGVRHFSVNASVMEPVAGEEKAGIISIWRDITERKRTEEALRLSEDRYRRILDSSRNHIVVMDENVSLLFANRSWATDTGYTIDDFKNSSFSNITHPDDLEKVSKWFLRVLGGESLDNVEYRRIIKNGETRWVESTASLIQWPGVEHAIVNVSQDITERKKAEEALRNSEERYRMLVEEAQDIIFSLDPNTGVVTGANSYAEKTLGYNRKEFPNGIHLQDLIHPDDFDEAVRNLQERFVQNKRHPNFPFRLRKTDDSYIDAEINAALIYDTEGKPQTYLGVVRDITERKRAEEALRESEEKFRDLVENVNNIIYAADANGAITYASPAVETVMEYDPTEVIGRHFSKFIHPEDVADVAKEFQRILSGHMEASEYRIVMKSGKTRWMRSSSRPIAKGNQVVGMQGVLTDITDRKDAEERLAESHSLLAATLESSADGITVADIGGKPLIHNQRFLELTRIPEDIIASADEYAERAYLLNQVKDPAAVVRMMEEIYDRPDAERTDIVEFKDGRILERHSRPQKIGGKTVGIVTSLRDITERNRAEAALRASEERYRSLVENMALGINMIDTDYTIVMSNAAIGGMLNKTASELIGKKCFREFEKKKAVCSHCPGTRAMVSGKAETVETEAVRDDGSHFNANLHAFPIIGQDGTATGFIEVVEDITERKRADEQVRMLSSRLSEAKETERKLLAQEIHDSIGASLAAIKYGLEQKLDQMTGTPPSEVKSLEQIISIVQNTIEETRRISTNLRPSMLDDLGIIVTINWFCREFQNIYSGIQVEKQIDVHENDVPQWLKIVIFRVLQEAFNNVAKHSGAGLVRLSLGRADGNIYLSVEDNGQGFDLEEGQADANYARGIGLASMKERTELSRGVFSVQSTRGEGTTIVASWPCA